MQVYCRILLVFSLLLLVVVVVILLVVRSHFHQQLALCDKTKIKPLLLYGEPEDGGVDPFEEDFC